MYKIIIILTLYCNYTFAYEIENKLKAIVIGKIAKFVLWQDNKTDNFKISIFNSKSKEYFKGIYKNKFIDNKKVEIEYIYKVEEIKNSQVLYIEDSTFETLQSILRYTNGKQILTISDMRGFVQKGGMVQIYKKGQKLKLRINLDNTQDNNIKIKSSLLRIVETIRGKQR